MMLGISFSELNLKMNQISTYESCNANRNAKKKKIKKKKWSLNVVTISMLPRHYEDTVYF